MLNLELPATASSARRSCQFWEVSGDDTHNAVLVIHEDRTRKNAALSYTESTRYAVADMGLEYGDRVFLIVKDEHKGREDLKSTQAGAARIGDVYECRALGGDGPFRCTCPGFNATKSCKHVHAMTLILPCLPDPRDIGSDRGGATEVAEQPAPECDPADHYREFDDESDWLGMVHSRADRIGMTAYAR